MKEAKEFGNLSSTEIKELLGVIGELKLLRKDLSAVFRGAGSRDLGWLGDDFSWVALHDLSLDELLGVVVTLNDMSAVILEAADSENPEQFLLGEHARDLSHDEESQQHTMIEKKAFTAAMIALLVNIECMELFGESVHKVLQRYSRTKSNKLLKSLLKIDHTLIAHPAILAQLSKAQLSRDREFMHQISLSFCGEKGGKSQAYSELRYLLAVLNENGCLESMTDERKYELFCNELNIYSSRSSDPKGSLVRLIQRIRKEWTT